MHARSLGRSRAPRQTGSVQRSQSIGDLQQEGAPKPLVGATRQRGGPDHAHSLEVRRRGRELAPRHFSGTGRAWRPGAQRRGPAGESWAPGARPEGATWSDDALKPSRSARGIVSGYSGPIFRVAPRLPGRFCAGNEGPGRRAETRPAGNSWASRAPAPYGSRYREDQPASDCHGPGRCCTAVDRGMKFMPQANSLGSVKRRSHAIVSASVHRVPPNASCVLTCSGSSARASSR
jgi:hypothetical protein